MSEWQLGKGGFELNRDPDTRALLDFPSEVFIVDSTIRSLQSSVSGSRHAADDLVEIGLALDRLGVRELLINLSWADGLEVVEKLASARPNARIVGTFRASLERAPEYLEAGIATGVDEICIESAPSVTFLEHAAERLREAGKDISHAFAEALSWDELVELSTAAVRCGSRSLSFHDSYFRMGVNPEAMKVFIRRVRTAVPHHPPLYVHLSNFYGQATMTGVAAVTAGASAIDVCLNLTGHHCGHISLAEAVMVLEDLYDIRTGIDLERISETLDVVKTRSGVPIRLQQPVIGEYAFMVDGTDRAAEAHLRYDDRMHSLLPFPPRVVGAEERVIWTHRTARSDTIALRLASLGLPSDQKSAQRALQLLQGAVEGKKEYPAWLTDDEFVRLLESQSVPREGSYESVHK